MSAERSNYMYSIKRTFTITIVEGILILTPKVPETNPSVTVRLERVSSLIPVINYSIKT